MFHKTISIDKIHGKYTLHLEMDEDNKAVQPNEIKITAVYQIKIQDWTGKRQLETSEYLDSYKYTPTNPLQQNNQ